MNISHSKSSISDLLRRTITESGVSYNALQNGTGVTRASITGNSGVLQPIMPLDLPVKVRPWELTVYPRGGHRGQTDLGASGSDRFRIFC